jgi:hypothetical protein
MLVCALCVITHTNYVDRLHSMKMVKDSMGLETAMIPCTHKSDRLHSERTHEGASGRVLTLTWKVQLWLNTRSTRST